MVYIEGYASAGEVCDSRHPDEFPGDHLSITSYYTEHASLYMVHFHRSKTTNSNVAKIAK